MIKIIINNYINEEYKYYNIGININLEY